MNEQQKIANAKLSIPIKQIVRVDAAMQSGIEILLTDNTRWRTLFFRFGKQTIYGEFKRHKQ